MACTAVDLHGDTAVEAAVRFSSGTVPRRTQRLVEDLPVKVAQCAAFNSSSSHRFLLVLQ